MSALDQILADRKTKLDNYVAAGINTYATGFQPLFISSDIRNLVLNKTPEELEELKNIPIAIAGRIVSNRVQGKLGFADLLDRDGKIQLMAKLDNLGPESLAGFKNLDEGDIVGIEGFAMLTKAGEPTVAIKSWQLLTKNMMPLGDKYHGVTDIDTRYRKRYIDLFADWQNPDATKKLAVREIFQRRAVIIKTIRSLLEDGEFLEVETPTFHHGVSGANAKPFETHHNTLDLDLHLRIAPELYLKRLLVGGLERVFEIGKNFRNEGISAQHSPEFTMLELYWAYASHAELMNLIEQLFVNISNQMVLLDERRVARGYAAIGNVVYNEDNQYELTYGDHKLSLAPFQRLTMIEAIAKYLPTSNLASFITDEALNNLETILSTPEALMQLIIASTLTNRTQLLKATYGEQILFFFETVVEHNLINPTFIMDFPADISPLSRKKDDNFLFVDRFELYVAGKEIANGFNELNDPVDQKTRFQAQLAAKANGNQEAMDYDEDYINALEIGMPPAAGLGIGIDRLVMLFTNSSSIREVILFPLLRPENK